MPFRLLLCRACVLALGCACWAGAALAEDQVYSTTVDGAEREPKVLLYYADGAPYIPLFDLAQQLGGSGRVVSPTQAEITLNGRTVTLSLNNVRYEEGGAAHDMQRPFLPYEKEVLAPREDVTAFMNTAFGLSLNADAAPAAAAEASAEEPPLLEPVPLPTPTETPAPAATPAAAEGAAMPEETGLLETEAITAPKEEPKPGALKAIIIDAGHGGSDPGAQGSGGENEKDISLAIATRLAALLQEGGTLTVVLTRSEDKAMTAAERGSIASQQDGAYLISIHAGAGLVPDATGVELFYPGDFSRSRVTGSQARVATEALARGLQSESGATLRGVRRAPMTLFTQAKTPGCLVEVGMLSNADEAAKLANADYQEKIARGLAIGLRKLAEGN